MGSRLAAAVTPVTSQHPDRVEPAGVGVHARLEALLDALVSAVGGAALVVDDQERLLAHSCDTSPVPTAYATAVLRRRLEPLRQSLGRPRTLSSHTAGTGGAAPLTSYQLKADDQWASEGDAKHGGMALEARIGSTTVTLGAVWLLAPRRHCEQEQVRAVLRATASFAGSAIAAGRSPAVADPTEQRIRQLIAGTAPDLAGSADVRFTIAALTVPGEPPEKAVPALHALVDAVRLQTVTASEQVSVLMDGDRVYLLVETELAPATRNPGASAKGSRTTVDQLVADATRRLGITVHAGVGPFAVTPTELPRARQLADEVLNLPSDHRPCRHVEDLGATLYLNIVRGLLTDLEVPVDDPVAALMAWDRRRGTAFTPSLRAWLDAFGDTQAAAEHLGVHVNTLRYRIKRALTLGGVDVTDPEQRLALHLRLTCASSHAVPVGARRDAS